jgi:hypothetical protein
MLLWRSLWRTGCAVERVPLLTIASQIDLQLPQTLASISAVWDPKVCWSLKGV